MTIVPTKDAKCSRMLDELTSNPFDDSRVRVRTRLSLEGLAQHEQSIPSGGLL